MRKTDTAFNTYAGALQVTSISAIDQYYNSHDPPSLRRHNYPLVRPLQHSKWSKGKDGFLTTDIWGTEVNSLLPMCPTVWLHLTEEKMFLLAYQHRGLTVMLLVPVSSVSGDQGISILKQQIIENVRVCPSNVLRIVFFLLEDILLSWMRACLGWLHQHD